jgi:Sad1 / UNC-like C-terminal
MSAPPSLDRAESNLRSRIPSRESSGYFSSLRWQASGSLGGYEEKTGHGGIRPAMTATGSFPAANQAHSLHAIDCSFFLILLAIVIIGSLCSLYSMSSRINALEARVFRLTRDSTGRQDFALRYGGGQINHALTTQAQPPPSMVKGINPAVQAIDDSLRPGNCWLLGGRTGQIGIDFPEAVIITHITIDHVAKELVSSLENAPRTMHVWGFTKGGSQNVLVGPNSTIQPAIIQRDLSFSFLGSIEYDIHKDDNIQTFPISQMAMAMKLQLQGVVVEVVDNWGKNSTCIYRVRVHGWQ